VTINLGMEEKGVWGGKKITVVKKRGQRLLFVPHIGGGKGVGGVRKRKVVWGGGGGRNRNKKKWGWGNM